MYKRNLGKPFRRRGVIVVFVFMIFIAMILPSTTMAETIDANSSKMDVSGLKTMEDVEIQAPVVEKVSLEGDGREANQVLDEMNEKNGVVLFADTSGADDGELAVKAISSDNVTFTYNKVIRYENFFTRNFTVSYDGKSKVAYCIEPKADPPDKGSHTAMKYDNRLMTKALYYSYGYPGYEKNTKPYLDKCSMHDDYRGTDGAYAISHLLLSYLYDNKSDSSDAFEGVSASTKKLIKQLAIDMEKNWPEVPEDASLSFDITQASAQWNKERQIQETPVITLKGHRDNKISVTVPSGVTMVKLSGNELNEYTSGTAGTTDTESHSEELQTVDVYGGDEFYFTAPAAIKGQFQSGQLIGSLQDFQTYLIKVSSKQDIMYCGDGGKDAVSFSIDWIDVGSFTLNKVSAAPEITENNEDYSLEGAEYVISNEDGMPYENLVTDADGIAQIMLPYGEYTLKERTAPKGYEVDTKGISITVNSDETALEHKEQIIPPKEKADNSPKTGDNDWHYALMLGIAVLSAIASILVFIRKRPQ